MDFRIWYGIAILFLLIEIVVLRLKILRIQKLVNLIKDMHESTLNLAHAMKGWYDEAQKSNKVVDEHYDLVSEQYSLVMCQYKTLMDIIKNSFIKSKNREEH